MEEDTEKKSYEAPTLTNYGTIQEVTENGSQNRRMES